jgi:beta-glucosidase
VFVNADSGEGYLTVDENAGDRKNMTFWRNGDEVIKTASEKCNNTIVVMHTVGPVLIDSWYDNPNITGIIWAGLPGQESGNAITEVLYGRANPGGKTPFTWGKTHEDYGVSLLYEPNNGHGAPQNTYSEGVFIDYRHFDKYDVTPVYEFGYGLSYTSFAFSDLKVSKMRAGPYKPTKGMTRDAPTFGSPPGKISEYLYPSGLNRIAKFIYPWLNSTNLKESSDDPDYGMENSEYLPEGATDGSPQHLLPASGAPGGNRGLYEDLIHVSAKIKNTGKVTGDEVPQLVSQLTPHVRIQLT